MKGLVTRTVKVRGHDVYIGGFPVLSVPGYADKGASFYSEVFEDPTKRARCPECPKP